MKLRSPIALIIFNRPELTQIIFDKIAQVKPSKLFVVADGPRPDRAGEENRCFQAREIINQVNWDCEVFKNYSDENLGCKSRVSSGLDWVFEAVPEVIILEDDCNPSLDFFWFCDELLEKYRDDERISIISGCNFQMKNNLEDSSYYFSRLTHIWGWASWRRTWRYYDVSASSWPEFRNYLLTTKISMSEKKFWLEKFQSTYDGLIDTWDYQLVLAMWAQHKLSIIPNVNLISNIGFGADATHTSSVNIFSNMSSGQLSFPLKHPQFMLDNLSADDFTANAMFSSGILNKIFRKIKKL